MKQAGLVVGEKLLRKKEVALLLACSARSIGRLASSGRLDRVKVLGAVRFRLSQVQALMGGGVA
jgi:predicted DNA-binding transcriptional regulator AlpA